MTKYKAHYTEKDVQFTADIAYANGIQWCAKYLLSFTPSNNRITQELLAVGRYFDQKAMDLKEETIKKKHENKGKILMEKEIVPSKVYDTKDNIIRKLADSAYVIKDWGIVVNSKGGYKLYIEVWDSCPHPDCDLVTLLNNCEYKTELQTATILYFELENDATIVKGSVKATTKLI